MRVLIDTNIFIKASTEGIEVLSKSTRKVVEDPETERCLSSISTGEIAIKSAVGKLTMNSDAVLKAAEYLRLTMLPFTAAHAQRLFHVPLFADHRDPFDRMLIATALAEDVPIVTTDRQFKRYRGLRVLS